MLLLASSTAILVIGVPGALVGVALRLRGLWLAGSAPLLGICAVGVATLWTHALGVRWSWWAVAATAAVLGGLALVAARFVKAVREPDLPAGWSWAAPIAVGIGGLLLTMRFVAGIGQPDWFAQSGDNVFHLNAVRWLLDHGDASPFGIVRFASNSSGTFYPDTWHAIVALTCQITGAPIPLGSNALFFTVSCVIWPAGVVLLTRSLFGSATSVLVASGAICAGFVTYPFLLAPYMGTYPLVFAIALVPAALACAVNALGLARSAASRPMTSLVLALAIPAIALTHPSAFTMLAVLCACPVLAALKKFAHGVRARMMPACLVAVIYVCAVVLLILFVRPSLAQPNSPQSPLVWTVFEALSGGFVGLAIPLTISALMLVGATVVLALREQNAGVSVGLWVVVACLYCAAASMDETIRVLLTEPWYADAERVAAFTPIAVVPLAARGAEWIWDRLINLSAASSFTPLRRQTMQITAIALLSALALQSSAVESTSLFMRALYTPAASIKPPQHVSLTTPIPLSQDDRALLSKLDSIVPPGATIAGNPWNGYGFAYALAGRRVLLPSMLTPIEGETKAFMQSFAHSEPAGPGCRAARRLGIGWILDLHPDRIAPTRPRFTGLENLAASNNVTVAARVGDSSLYKVTGCETG